MIMNKLKMNSDKTEILVFSSSHRPRPALDFLDMCVAQLLQGTLGLFLDGNSLSMAPHVAAVCKSCFFHLRNIFKFRKFLSVDSAKTLVHAFVTSKVDYCNSLLYGQPKCVLCYLQRVLNCSARLIYSSNLL